jgi:hypothetical protein
MEEGVGCVFLLHVGWTPTIINLALLNVVVVSFNLIEFRLIWFNHN